jgi:hypothetical protein
MRKVLIRLIPRVGNRVYCTYYGQWRYPPHQIVYTSYYLKRAVLNTHLLLGLTASLYWMRKGIVSKLFDVIEFIINLPVKDSRLSHVCFNFGNLAELRLTCTAKVEQDESECCNFMCIFCNVLGTIPPQAPSPLLVNLVLFISMCGTL